MERYKAEIIAAIPQGEAISLYRQGDFIDLCRGPHLPSTGRLGKGVQIDEIGWSLLARRFQPSHATADLRHRMAQRKGP